MSEDGEKSYFPGLPAGDSVSETCVNYLDHSVNITEQDGDQQFDLYKNADCKGPKNYSLVLEIDVNLAGIWQNFLVLDEGTDVNGHNLRLVSLTDNDEFYTLAFEGDAPRSLRKTKLFISHPAKSKPNLINVVH